MENFDLWVQLAPLEQITTIFLIGIINKPAVAGVPVETRRQIPFWGIGVALKARHMLLGVAAVLLCPWAQAAQTITYPAPGGESERLHLHAATDRQLIEPLIHGFQKFHPKVAVDYVDMNTGELYEIAIKERSDSVADLLISSATDLQVKLVNDGYSQPYISEATLRLPDWANWRNEAFGFTFEPAMIAYNRMLVGDAEAPRSRDSLIRLLQNEMQRFHRRVATYDIVESGIGYLLATQDSLLSGQFWQLMATLGRAQARLACCTATILDMIERGEVLIAYNVLGSYAQARVMSGALIGLVMPEDYTLVMSRVAVIPKLASHPQLAGRFIDYLISAHAQEVMINHSTFHALTSEIKTGNSVYPLYMKSEGPMLPITLSPALLVFLDDLKRDHFLQQWQFIFQTP